MPLAGDTPRLQRGAALIRHGLEVIRSYISKDHDDSEDVYYAGELFTWRVEGLSLAGRKDEAVTASREIMKLVEQSAEKSPSDPNPRLRLASLDESLGNIYAGYDDRTHSPTATDRAELIEARRSYQKGLDVPGETIHKFKVSAASAQDQMQALRENVD